MQASWYELELGDSYQRAGMYLQALTQYTNVEKVIFYPFFFFLFFFVFKFICPYNNNIAYAFPSLLTSAFFGLR